MQQTRDTILMIRPVQFRMNEQTKINNYYQKVIDNVSPETVNTKAQQEFDAFVEKLRAKGINVVVVDDTKEFDTPDSIFPNNWISFHENGTVAIYPMFAENRRLERREDVLVALEEQGFKVNDVVDYTEAEDEDVFLECTGSLLLDRENRKAYCAVSPRADESLFIEFCEDFEYSPVVFTANQTVNEKRVAIYHTNVMMCLAETFAVICLDAIDDKKERVRRYHNATIKSFSAIIGAMGYTNPSELSPAMIYRRINSETTRSLDEIYDYVAEGVFLNEASNYI